MAEKKPFSDERILNLVLSSPSINQLANSFSQFSNVGYRGEGKDREIIDIDTGKFVANVNDLKTKLATDISEEGYKQFKSIVGRDPTVPELASIFDRNFSLEDVLARRTGKKTFAKGEFDVKSYLAGNKEAITGNFVKDVIGNIINVEKPKFDAVTLAQLQGGQLADEDISQIVAPGTSPESADVLAAGLLKSRRDKAVEEELKTLPQREEEAISELDRALSQSQSRSFSEDFLPAITGQLNARELLFSGDLASSLAETAGKLGREREGVIAPLRAQAKLGGGKLHYENILRGALESGQSLSNATQFARDLYNQQKQREFSASQAELGRRFGDEQNRQNLAFQTALAGGGGRSPSPLDYFLQYGLPTLSTLGGGALSGYLSRTPKR